MGEFLVVWFEVFIGFVEDLFLYVVCYEGEGNWLVVWVCISYGKRL